MSMRLYELTHQKIILMHGSPNADFESFDTFDFDAIPKRNFGGGLGLHWTNDFGLVRQYAGPSGVIFKAEIRFSNPYVIDYDMTDRPRAFLGRKTGQSTRDWLHDEGHDAVLIKQGSYIEVIIWTHEQISVIETSGR